MNYEDKINQIIEINEIRSKLKRVGVIPYAIGPTGPTGPRGKGIEILGNYNSLDELKNEIQNCTKCKIWGNEKEIPWQGLTDVI